MLARMNMNPIRVTMFGASHSGNSSTAAFHYSHRYVSASWSQILELRLISRRGLGRKAS